MTTPLDPTPSADLWDELRLVLRHALAIFGEPAELWDDLVLPRAQARRLHAWIASLEAAARALLFVMAAALPRPAPARRPAARPAAAPDDLATDEPAADPGAGASADDAAPAETPSDDGASAEAACCVEPAPPETPDSRAWARVAFRIAPRSGPGGPRGARGVRSFLPVRGLARRLEALLRVAVEPAPFARRLARRLDADPGLPARALRRPAWRRRDHPPPYDDLVEDALGLARSAGFPAPG